MNIPEKVIETKLLLTTERFRVVEVESAGEGGSGHRRAVIRHPGAVTLIPMVDEDHVCLIRNFRASVSQALIELPAGTLEANEDPAACANRELAEETGFRAENIELLHRFYLSPGILDEQMHLFLATNLTSGSAAREAGEEIENRIVPWREAIGMIDDGEIFDAKTIVGLLYWDRLRSRRR